MEKYKSLEPIPRLLQHLTFYSLYSTRSGQILIAVLILLAVGVALGGAYFSSVSYHTIISGREVNVERASALADAGVNRAIFELKASSSWSGIGETTLGDGSYEVILASSTGEKKIFDVIGYVPNKLNPKAKRHIRITFVKEGRGGPFAYGVQSGTGGLELNSNAIIKGSAYSNANITCYSNSKVEGDAFAVGTITPGCPTGSSNPGSSPRPLPPFDFAYWANQASSGGTISGNVEYDSGFHTLGPKKIDGNLTITSNAILRMTGPIYVTGNFEMGGNSVLELDPAFGDNSTVLLAGGRVQLNSNSGVKRALYTKQMRPNSDFATAWIATPSGSQWSNIDDNVTQPTTADTSDYITSGTDNQVAEFDMTTFSDVATTTGATIWVYARTAKNDRLGVDLIVDGVSQGEQTLTGLTTSYNWYNATFTGTWNQSQVDGMRVRLKEIRNGPQDSVDVAAMYVDLSYYSPESGYIMLVASSTATSSPMAIELNSNSEGGAYYALNGGIQVNSNAHPVALTGVLVSLNSNAVILYDTGLADEQFTIGPSAGWVPQAGSWRVIE